MLDQLLPAACQRISEEGSRNGASSNNLYSLSSSGAVCEVCARCLAPSTPAESESENEIVKDEARSYLSIIHRLQEKIRVLQEALITSSRCSELITSSITGTEGDICGGSTSIMMDMEYQNQQQQYQKKRSVSGEGYSTRRRRTEWTHALETNSTVLSFQNIASRVHLEDFNEWRKEVSFSFPSNDSIGGGYYGDDARNSNNNNNTTNIRILNEENYKNNNEEEINKKNSLKVGVGAPTEKRIGTGLAPYYQNSDNRTKLSGESGFVLDSVIILDITSIMNKRNNTNSSVVELCNKNIVQEKRDKEEINQLNIKNIKLNEDFKKLNQQLELGNKEVESRKNKIEELNDKLKQLKQFNDELQEESNKLRLEYKNKVEKIHELELKLKDTTTTLNSLKPETENFQKALKEAREEAEAAWNEVRRLESALREWDSKERELKRLRLLMRFSELKKDSDKLLDVVGHMELMDKEKQQLREENRRCRTLLAEYRRRLDEVYTSSTMKSTEKEKTESTMKSREKENTESTVLLKSTEKEKTNGSRGSERCQLPTRPASACTSGRKPNVNISNFAAESRQTYSFLTTREERAGRRPSLTRRPLRSQSARKNNQFV